MNREQAQKIVDDLTAHEWDEIAARVAEDMDDTHPIDPNCRAARIACGWSWVDWIVAGYMALALVCEVMLAAQIAAGSVRWQTVVVTVLAVVGMFGFGVLREAK